jgi:hypothetical protein
MVGATSAVTFHFTPTSASWLNAVEGFFATLSKRRLKRRRLRFRYRSSGRQPSTASSRTTTPIPNPSNGSLIQTESSQP